MGSVAGSAAMILTRIAGIEYKKFCGESDRTGGTYVRRVKKQI